MNIFKGSPLALSIRKVKEDSLKGRPHIHMAEVRTIVLGSGSTMVDKAAVRAGLSRLTLEELIRQLNKLAAEIELAFIDKVGTTSMLLWTWNKERPQQGTDLLRAGLKGDIQHIPTHSGQGMLHDFVIEQGGVRILIGPIVVETTEAYIYHRTCFSIELRPDKIKILTY